jgi:acyl carrier protein
MGGKHIKFSGMDGVEMQPEIVVRINRMQIRELMEQVLANHGRTLPAGDGAALRDIGFRSLDFSELALRVEDAIDRELNFDAPALRRIATVADVLNLLVALQDG